MSKFKVGDEVIRTASHDYDYMYMESGKVYIVSQVFGPEGDECIYVDNYQHFWDADYFELYQPKQLEPTELTECYAKIDTLESALEDAVRELISLREGNNTVVIDVDNNGFKPINEMVYEDWLKLYESGIRPVFLDTKGRELTLNYLWRDSDTKFTYSFKEDNSVYSSYGVNLQGRRQLVKRIK